MRTGIFAGAKGLYRARRAVTLVELLVVIGITGSIATLSFFILSAGQSAADKITADVKQAAVKKNWGQNSAVAQHPPTEHVENEHLVVFQPSVVDVNAEMIRLAGTIPMKVLHVYDT